MNNLGQTIRKLRTAENLTQEKLAEELHVSFQSISRWENGISAPDIDVIPAIARFFGVSTDYLFGIRNEENEITRQEIENEYLEMRARGDLDGAYEVMDRAHKIFPRDLHFCVNLAEVMDLFEGGNSAQLEKYKEFDFSRQIFHLCSKAAQESHEETDRSKALRLLAIYHMKAGNVAKALQIASSMSDILNSREIILGEILQGEEKKRALQENILLMADYIADKLVKIAFQKEYGYTEHMTPQEKLEYVTAANAVLKAVISDGNYLAYSRKLGWNYRRMAELYSLMGQRENAMECLLEAEKMATAYDSIDRQETHRYTSKLCNLVDGSRFDDGKRFVGTEREMLAYRLDEMGDYFKNDEQFSLLRARLGESNIILN